MEKYHDVRGLLIDATVISRLARVARLLRRGACELLCRRVAEMCRRCGAAAVSSSK